MRPALRAAATATRAAGASDRPAAALTSKSTSAWPSASSGSQRQREPTPPTAEGGHAGPGRGRLTHMPAVPAGDAPAVACAAGASRPIQPPACADRRPDERLGQDARRGGARARPGPAGPGAQRVRPALARADAARPAPCSAYPAGLDQSGGDLPPGGVGVPDPWSRRPRRGGPPREPVDPLDLPGDAGPCPRRGGQHVVHPHRRDHRGPRGGRRTGRHGDGPAAGRGRPGSGQLPGDYRRPPGRPVGPGRRLARAAGRRRRDPGRGAGAAEPARHPGDRSASSGLGCRVRPSGSRRCGPR